MPSDRPLVFLTRHGETEWNSTLRMQGHTDTPLSARGEAQATRLGARLAREGLARIVSSDLLRARRTAEVVAGVAGLPLVLDARLREQHLGSWEGSTFAQALIADPEIAERFAARHPDARPPRGETRAELAARAWAAFEEHAAAGTPGPILFVSHGGAIHTLLARVLGIGLDAPRRFLLPNASISTLVWGREAWWVRSLSDASHLEGGVTENFPY